MKVKAYIYKIFSLFQFILTFIFIISANVLMFLNKEKIDKILKYGKYGTLLYIGVVVFSIIILFFAYMKSSSMQLYSNVQLYNYSNANLMKKPLLTLPAKAYGTFGLIVYSLLLFATVVSIIFLVIYESKKLNYFICIPFVKFVAILILNYVCYMEYYLIYKAITDLSQVSMNIDDSQKELEEINGSSFVGYTVFFGIIEIVIVVRSIMMFTDYILPLNIAILNTVFWVVLFIEILIAIVHMLYMIDISKNIKILKVNKE